MTRPRGREQLLQELEMAGRAMSAATVMFHSTVAARHGLSATEEKALDLLERFGPLTAGELAKRSGLAPASGPGRVTRLERKGFARRIAHPSDRRSILIEVDPERLYAAMAPLFADWFGSLEELWASYRDEPLAR